MNFRRSLFVILAMAAALCFYIFKPQKNKPLRVSKTIKSELSYPSPLAPVNGVKARKTGKAADKVASLTSNKQKTPSDGLDVPAASINPSEKPASGIENDVPYKDMAIIEQRWHEIRDELYENILQSDQEYEALLSFRREREQFLDIYLSRGSSFVSSLTQRDWDEIAMSADWFEHQVRSMLGESRYAMIVKARDKFNESLKNDPSRVISISTDW